MKRFGFLKKAYELFLLAMLLIAGLFAMLFLVPVLFSVVSVLLLYFFKSGYRSPRRGIVMLQ